MVIVSALEKQLHMQQFSEFSLLNVTLDLT